MVVLAGRSDRGLALISGGVAADIKSKPLRGYEKFHQLRKLGLLSWAVTAAATTCKHQHGQRSVSAKSVHSAKQHRKVTMPALPSRSSSTSSQLSVLRRICGGPPEKGIIQKHTAHTQEQVSHQVSQLGTGLRSPK